MWLTLVSEHMVVQCTIQRAVGMHAAAIPSLKAHLKIPEQLEYLLHRRLIQELELLRDRLEAAPHQTANPGEWVIRALSLDELHSITTDKSGALPGVAAIISFKEAVGNASASETDGSPIFSVHQIKDRSSVFFGRSLPLYDASRFLAADARQQVQALLKEILRIENRAHRKFLNKKSFPRSNLQLSCDEETPVGYLLRSTSQTLHRVDTVPVCIALWRLQLWNGQGWSDSFWGPWEANSIPSDVPENT